MTQPRTGTAPCSRCKTAPDALRCEMKITLVDPAAAAMHVQSACHAGADQPRNLRVPVPPTMNGWSAHAALGVRGQEPPSARPLLGVEDEVVRLRCSLQERQKLQVARVRFLPPPLHPSRVLFAQGLRHALSRAFSRRLDG